MYEDESFPQNEPDPNFPFIIGIVALAVAGLLFAYAMLHMIPERPETDDLMYAYDIEKYLEAVANRAYWQWWGYAVGILGFLLLLAGLVIGEIRKRQK